MKRIFFIAAAALLLTGCYYKTDTPRGSWAKGCDLSWLSEMEHDGVLFYGDGVPADAKPTKVKETKRKADVGENARPQGEQDCIALLRGLGMNSVRLRVWVNHSTGWSNKDDMLALAKRAAKQGQRIMIDIHYSDFFADPSHQTIPEAWKDYDFATMRDAVREHTLDVLYALKEEGIKPEWVQIGNETPNGMLWPMGRIDGEETTDEAWDRYAGLTRAGYDAAKEAFSDINVIVHIDNAYMYRDWFWTNLAEHGGKWDMIGLSHYPMMFEWCQKPWQEMNQLAETNVKRLIQEWHCPVMICEVGMLNYGVGYEYDFTAMLSNIAMTDFVERMQRIDSCAGIFYWEPEVYGGWRPAEYIPLGWGSYNMGAFTPNGRPAPALRTLLYSKKANTLE